jgi:hypothetical protein
MDDPITDVRSFEKARIDTWFFHANAMSASNPIVHGRGARATKNAQLRL